MALADDLNNLDFTNISGWPAMAKAILIILLIAAVGGAGYWFDTKDMLANLESERRKEPTLKQEFEEKQAVVANIDAYRARLEELKILLAELVEQLPTSTEMPDLIEQISDTGRSNGLDFQLFRPAKESKKDFFATVPIAIEARASYHQFGTFVSNIAALERIVTLENATLQASGGGLDSGELSVKATVQTYRYLEESE